MSQADATACAGALETVIREALATAQRLESALATERAALEARDAAALHTAGAGKQELLSRLDELDGRRRRLLADHGYPADQGGVEAVLAACAPAHSLSGLWRELGAVAGRCRDANAANGAIVHLRQRQIGRALDVLRGAPEGAAPVYGADGSSARAGGRAFGSA
ncbi:flagella synthesis protein FlgN [Lentisalinibacter orientalis]|uniref:flagella synthesis protein FlgN n=1 Tax=Lentisalinibacter orientalis TaxID=2992241 RepID=UPI00386BF7D9